MPVSDDAFLEVIRESLKAITAPRFFQTERGYQGELLAELRKRVPEIRGLQEDVVVEQEHQKRLVAHGLRIRPDVIIHVPFDQRHHPNRKYGNYVSFELKLRATPAGARSNYESLTQLMNALDYPLGIFINIGSTDTHITQAAKPASGRIVGFGVVLRQGRVEVNEQAI